MPRLARCLSMAIVALALATPHAVALVDPEVAGYIAVPGGRIWYRINGTRHFASGATALLAVHGGPGGSHRSALPLLALADERPVILYDQLDSGNSDRPGDPVNWTLERFVAEIGAIRAHLGLSRVVVLGHSWGGAVAAAYAASQPAGLEAIVLTGPLISTSRWITDNAEYVAALPADVRDAIARHEAAGTYDDPEYQAAVKVYNSSHLCRGDPCPLGDTRNDAAPGNVTLYRTMWGPSEFTATGSLRGLDLSPRLARIQVPALYICGTYDEATPAACRDFAAQTPGARFVEAPDTAHMVPFESPAFYIDTIRRFLAEHND